MSTWLWLNVIGFIFTLSFAIYGAHQKAEAGHAHGLTVGVIIIAWLCWVVGGSIVFLVMGFAHAL